MQPRGVGNKRQEKLIVSVSINLRGGGEKDESGVGRKEEGVQLVGSNGQQRSVSAVSECWRAQNNRNGNNGV